MEFYRYNQIVQFPKRKKISAIIAFAFISFIMIFVFLFLSSHPSIFCRIYGGTWLYPVIYSSSTVDAPGICIYTYSDGGKVCQSSNDCQGDCLSNKCANTSISGRRIDFFGQWEAFP
jgi:hypothetical protein